MILDFMLVIGGVILMTVAVGVLLVKFIHLYLIRNRLDGSLHVKFFSWYNNLELYGSDSAQHRKFMRLSNKLSAFFWGAVVLFVFLLILENLRSFS